MKPVVKMSESRKIQIDKEDAEFAKEDARFLDVSIRVSKRQLIIGTILGIGGASVILFQLLSLR